MLSTATCYWLPHNYNSMLVISSSGVDSSVELRLRRLHQRPFCGRPEQRHPADSWDWAGGGGEALMLQRATEAVPIQSLPAQRHLQGRLESLCLWLLWVRLPGPFLRERWERMSRRLERKRAKITLELDCVVKWRGYSDSFSQQGWINWLKTVTKQQLFVKFLKMSWG